VEEEAEEDTVREACKDALEKNKSPSSKEIPKLWSLIFI
jgi:hypothetical protein